MTAPTPWEVVSWVIVAICARYTRVGSQKDAEHVNRNTSSPQQVAAVDRKVEDLKAEFEKFQRIYFAENPPKPDHRGPERK